MVDGRCDDLRVGPEAQIGCQCGFCCRCAGLCKVWAWLPHLLAQPPQPKMLQLQAYGGQAHGN